MSKRLPIRIPYTYFHGRQSTQFELPTWLSLKFNHPLVSITLCLFWAVLWPMHSSVVSPHCTYTMNKVHSAEEFKCTVSTLCRAWHWRSSLRSHAPFRPHAAFSRAPGLALRVFLMSGDAETTITDRKNQAVKMMRHFNQGHTRKTEEVGRSTSGNPYITHAPMHVMYSRIITTQVPPDYWAHNLFSFEKDMCKRSPARIPYISMIKRCNNLGFQFGCQLVNLTSTRHSYDPDFTYNCAVCPLHRPIAFSIHNTTWPTNRK